LEEAVHVELDLRPRETLQHARVDAAAAVQDEVLVSAAPAAAALHQFLGLTAGEAGQRQGHEAFEVGKIEVERAGNGGPDGHHVAFAAQDLAPQARLAGTVDRPELLRTGLNQERVAPEEADRYDVLQDHLPFSTCWQQHHQALILRDLPNKAADPRVVVKPDLPGPRPRRERGHEHAHRQHERRTTPRPSDHPDLVESVTRHSSRPVPSSP